MQPNELAQHVELALKKQRLQWRAAEQRADMVRRLEGFEAALDVVDTVRDEFRWARDHAPLLSIGLLVVALRHPRRVLRVARRAWLGWALYRKGASLVAPLLAAIRRDRGPAARS